MELTLPPILIHFEREVLFYRFYVLRRPSPPPLRWLVEAEATAKASMARGNCVGRLMGIT
ncbi:hypothetical protein [Symmachiella dynata]|mgnify:CR=1 FL=1|uniref:hypothetical protein n=1 Tax=Symmachiella dynata TaxID=2527995 RepID=UPI0030EC6708